MGFGSATTYHPVNRLTVLEAGMKVNRRNTFDNIMMQGQWTVKKLDFNLNDQVKLRCLVTGAGTGFLYASYFHNGTNQILAIKRVTPGAHELKFTVPYPVLRDFKIGVSSTIPKGYSIDNLSKETKYKIRTNSMMLSQHAPMYETPGLGFAGLGAALLDINQSAKGGKDDANNPYWDGNWDNYSWNNGFFGDIDTQTVVGNERVPRTKESYHGYYASKHNIMLAKFDENDTFLGWDAVESGLTSRALPMGVPICIVMQFYVLPEMYLAAGSGKRKEHQSSKPEWQYADGVDSPPNLFCITSNAYTGIRYKVWKDTDPRPNVKTGLLKDVRRGINLVDNRWETNGNQCGIPMDGKRVNPNDVGFKLEWYDEASGTWSQPQVNPSSIPTTNEKGFTKVIFRIPRQLSEETDSDILSELDQLGVNYRHEATKNYFPYPIGDAPNYTTGYCLPNRPIAGSNYQQQVDTDGKTYASTRTLGMTFYFGYGKHPKAGHAGSDAGAPKLGAAASELYFKAADPAKSARFNNPELLTAFYPVGGFKTGGVIIGIGKGMSKGTFVMSKKSNFNIQAGADDLRAIRGLQSSDGSDIGTKESAFLKPTGVILSTDLEDDRETTTETEVLAAWKAKFGVPLTKDFFNKFSFKDQIPEKPTHYRARDVDSGLDFEAPYQIIYFKIPPEYNGPYVDYELVDETETNAEGVEEIVSKLKLTQPEGKPFALGTKDSLFLHTRTPYNKTFKVKLDIVDEVEEQRSLMASGLTEEETLAYNELNNPPEESTATTAEMTQEEIRLRELAPPEEAEEEDLPKLPSGAKYVRSGDKWRLNPTYYARESQLKDAGFLGGIKSALSGFTDSRDFYVEDVTDKWGANTRAGLGSIGLGNPLDYMLDYEVGDFVSDNLEDIGDVVQDALYATAYGAGALLELPVAVQQTAMGDFDGAYESSVSAVDKAETSIINAVSLPFSTADLALKLPGRSTRVLTTTTGNAVVSGADLVGDMVGLGAIAPRGLGESTAEKLERYGENTTSFFKGAAKGVIPNSIQDGFGDSIDAIVDTFNKRPVLYTAMGLAAVPLLIPGIGGAYARNVSILARGAVGLIPKTFRAGVDTISSVSSGAISGAKEIGESVVGTPSKRGTAARRRRYKRR